MLLPLGIFLFSSHAKPDALHYGPVHPSLHPRDARQRHKDKAHLPGFDTAPIRATGTHEEELFQSQVAVKDIALGQPIGSFQIKGREHLPRR